MGGGTDDCALVMFQITICGGVEGNFETLSPPIVQTVGGEVNP